MYTVKFKVSDEMNLAAIEEVLKANGVRYEVVRDKFDDSEQLLTISDVISYMHKGKDYVYGLFHSKKFPSFRIGGRYYVVKKDFMKYLEGLSKK